VYKAKYIEMLKKNAQLTKQTEKIDKKATLNAIKEEPAKMKMLKLKCKHAEE
jgi:hypothetical protein